MERESYKPFLMQSFMDWLSRPRSFTLLTLVWRRRSFTPRSLWNILRPYLLRQKFYSCMIYLKPTLLSDSTSINRSFFSRGTILQDYLLLTGSFHFKCPSSICFSFFRHGPGIIPSYPQSLNQLLVWSRCTTQKHLFRLDDQSHLMFCKIVVVHICSGNIHMLNIMLEWYTNLVSCVTYLFLTFSVQLLPNNLSKSNLLGYQPIVDFCKSNS